jgi:K(+)-stimulated pyrophosphate-energized sodium pump
MPLPCERQPVFHPLWLLGPIGALSGLLTAFYFYRQMMRESEGTETMTAIAGHVREGAHAYLRQQNKVVVSILCACFVGLLLLYFAGLQEAAVPPAFLLGGLCSALAGYLGMVTATNASARTCNAARERGLDAALRVAFRSGAVMGLTVVGIALLFIDVAFVVMAGLVTTMSLRESSVLMVSFGMGASFQALFARVGGGIFTKAADVGADLVGKVETGIPEDDPRNPATIADNVGDNVGDVAGMGADLYESYSSSILAAIALGVAAMAAINPTDTQAEMRAAIIPIAISGLGILASIAGIFSVRSREDASQSDLIHALDRGVYLASGILFAGSGGICWELTRGVAMPNSLGWMGLWGCIALGLAVGLGIAKATEYFTSYDYQPTRRIAEAGATGAATVIIEGTANGLLSTWPPVAAVCAGILGAFLLCGGFANMALGLFGVALASVGMLSTLGITLATDAYGPIADNAGGNAEMSVLPKEVRDRTDLLDAVGNTTAAIGKGFAIGSAALTAMALLAAYGEELKIRLIKAASEVPSFTVWGKTSIDEVQARAASYSDLLAWYDVTLLNPLVLVGLLIGATVAFVFSALTMRAVGQAATAMIEEVRRQFREHPGILEGTEKPDYAACVSISTRDAQSQMILPSLLVVAIPLLVGVLLGPAAVMGLLTGGLVTGFLLAVMMANAGGAWDNAKKFVEKGNHGGKGSEPHKAVVVGDTVGDPFKDTSGPALNVLIKLMAITAVVFAGLTVKAAPIVAAALGF